MNELEFQEEWLSAYLDDELTEGQRQVVEQRLAVDPAAQATLEDLQRVRAMVAKLPSWSGSDLKFAIPAEIPGSPDQANDAINKESDDQLDDFEMLRSLDTVEEPHVAVARPNWNSNSRSTGSMLRWIAMAASILLVAGVGYLMWPPTGRSIAVLESKQSTRLAPDSSSPDSAGSLPGLQQPDRTDPMFKDFLPETESAPPAVGEGRGGEGFAGSTDTERKQSILRSDPADTKSDSLVPGSEEPLAANGRASGMKASSIPDSSTQVPAQEVRGGFGGHEEMGLALDKSFPADAKLAELPPPHVASSTDREEEKTQLERRPVDTPNVYFARSQSWRDEETQSSLYSGTFRFGVNQLGFGNNNIRLGDTNHQPAEGVSDTVLMAAIKPEVANSPEFFRNMVTSNQFIAVEQQPSNNLLTLGDRLNSSVERELDAAKESNAAPVTEFSNAPVSSMFSTPGLQMAIPNMPTGNSFVLFVNRDEANRILLQLQENGQLASQVWRVLKRRQTQVAGKAVTRSAAVEPQNSADGQTLSDSANGRLESVKTDKVILMLNGPPN